MRVANSSFFGSVFYRSRGFLNLLLLPGMDGTGLLFGPLLDVLPDGLQPRVATYPANKSLGYAELLPLVRKACPTEPFIILAESFSGPLALMVAAEKPPALRGVILCASFVDCPLSPLLRRIAALVQPACFRWPSAWLMRRALLGGSGTHRLRQSLKAAITTAGPHVLAARTRAVANVDTKPELRNCRVPLLLLVGSRDRVVGRKGVDVIRQIRPDTEVVKLDGPHLLLQALPADAARIIARFSEQVAL